MPLIFDQLPVKRLRVQDAKTATLSDSEKEDREAKRLIQKSPEKKPPRQDLRRRRVKDQDSENDPDVKQDKKDRSNNYKDASMIRRIVTRHLSIRVARQNGKKSEEEDNRVKFLNLYGTKKVKNPVTGRDVLLSTLSSKTNRGEEREYEVYEKEYQKWLQTQKAQAAKKQEEEPVEEEEPAEEEKPAEEVVGEKAAPKDPSKALAGLADALKSGSGKKTEEARKKLIAEHPELEGVIKEQLNKYYDATKGLTEALRTSNPKSIEAAEAKLNQAIEDFRNIGKAEPEEAPEEDTEEGSGEPDAEEKPTPSAVPTPPTFTGTRPKSLPKTKGGNADRFELEAPDLDTWSISGKLATLTPVNKSPEDLASNLVGYQNLDLGDGDEKSRLQKALSSIEDQDDKDEFNKLVGRVKRGQFDMPILVEDDKGRLIALSGEDVLLASRVLGKPVSTMTIPYNNDDDKPISFNLEAGESYQQMEDITTELDSVENSYEMSSMLEGMKPNRRMEAFKTLSNMEPLSLKGPALDKAVKEMNAFFEKKRPKGAKIDPKELAENIHLMRYLAQAGDAKELESQTEDLLKKYPPEERTVDDVLENMNVFDRKTFNEQYSDEYDRALKEAKDSAKSGGASFAKKLKTAKSFFSEDYRGTRSPEETAKFAAILAADNKINNPIDRFGLADDLPSNSFSGPDGKAAALREATREAFEIFKDVSRLSSDTRESYIEKLTNYLDSTPENSPARIKAQSALNAVTIAHVAKTPPNEEVSGVSNILANAIRAAEKTGEVAYFLDQTKQFENPEDAQDDLAKNVGRIYQNLSDDDFLSFLPSDSPFGDMAEEALGPRSESSRLERDFVRETMQEYMLGNMRFVGAEDEEALQDQDAKRVLESLRDVRPNTPQNRERIRSDVGFLNRLWAKLFKKRNSEESTLNLGPSVPRVASRYLRSKAR